MIGRISGRSICCLDNMRRGGNVWVPYPEIDDVDPLGPNLFFLAINLFEKIRGQSF